MKKLFNKRKREELELAQDPYRNYIRVFWYSLALAVLVLLPSMIYELTQTGKLIFLYYGDYNVQQVPFYEHCVRMVHEGTVTWDWITDLGSNFVGSYSYYLLGSPFFWLMCLFPASWAPYLMGPIYVLKFVAAAVIAYAFLKRFVKNKDYAVIGALMYAFCGFQVYNLFFNQFHEVVALFPLMLIGMEELVQNDRKGVFAVAVAINCACNYFMFAGQVVFCIIYFLFRAFKKSYRLTLKKFGLLAFEAVLGVIMGMVLFLPAALAILGNYRLSYKFKDIKDMLVYMQSGKVYVTRYGHILQSLFFPPDIPSRVNFFYGHAARWSSNAAWLPMFGLSGVFAYLRYRKRSLLAWMVPVLTVFALVPILNSTFFLFNSNYYARWMYMLVLVAVAVTIMALDDEKVRFGFGLALNSAIIVAITAYCGLRWFHNTEDSNDFYQLGGEPFAARLWASVAIALACMILLHFIIKRLRGTKYFTRVLLVAMCFIIVLYANVHIFCGKSHSTSTERIVNEAVEGEFSMPGEEFYRIDFYRTPDNGMPSTGKKPEYKSKTFKMTSVFDNLGISWETPSVECFHSVVSPSIMNFYEAVGVTRNVGSRATYDKYGLLGFLSVKYSLVRNSSDKGNGKHITDEYNGLSFTDLQQSQNNYNIYENDYFVKMGFWYESFITQSEFEKIAKSNRHILLCSYLVVPDDEADYYRAFMTEAVENPAEGEEGYVKRASANYQTYIRSVGELQNRTCSSFERDGGSFKAEIALDSPNVVVFTVPYDDGWSATVNGKPVDIRQVTYGFMGVECSGSADGNYVIEFTYSVPGLLWGALASLFGVIVLVVYLLVCRRKGLKPSYKFFKEDYVEVECPEYFLSENAEQKPAADPEKLFNRAKTSLIVSIFAIPFLGVVLGLVGAALGASTLMRINKTEQKKGAGMAALAIALGVCAAAAYVVFTLMRGDAKYLLSLFI
ncbi:MAG: YfhO family protein [Clostridia bacterium]|nr:YfhO family protein [Clostridia bacterium]